MEKQTNFGTGNNLFSGLLPSQKKYFVILHGIFHKIAGLWYNESVWKGILSLLDSAGFLREITPKKYF